jgi:low affinity Fe/Cu permease
LATVRPVGWQRLGHYFERIAVLTTQWVGSTWAFLIALLLTTSWLVTGPLFHFSDTWQLVMNTVSSIVTFLMVFLLQRSQNKDSLAMQVKLNELVASQYGASNRLINVENLPESEVRALHRRFEQLAQRDNVTPANAQRSIDDASAEHPGP